MARAQAAELSTPPSSPHSPANLEAVVAEEDDWNPNDDDMNTVRHLEMLAESDREQRATGLEPGTSGEASPRHTLDNKFAAVLLAEYGSRSDVLDGYGADTVEDRLRLHQAAIRIQRRFRRRRTLRARREAMEKKVAEQFEMVG